MLLSSQLTSRSRGFTLLEIQIGLVLLVLIMGLLFSTLHLASKSWKTGLAKNDITEETRLVSEYLRRQLSQITPLFWSGTRGLDLIFKGQSDSILFVGKLPANRNTDQLSLLNLKVKSEAEVKSLVLGYDRLSTDYSPLTNASDKFEYTQVLEQVKSIEFSYYGQHQTRSKQLAWAGQWNNTRQLPKLIKCQIVMQTGVIWPELLIPVRVDNNRSFKQFILQAAPKRNGRNNLDASNNSNNEMAEHDIDELF